VPDENPNSHGKQQRGHPGDKSRGSGETRPLGWMALRDLDRRRRRLSGQRVSREAGLAAPCPAVDAVALLAGEWRLTVRTAVADGAGHQLSRRGVVVLGPAHVGEHGASIVRVGGIVVTKV
jgi:hypothetical protein